MERLNRRIETYWDERSENFSKTRRLELDGVDGVAWQNLFKKNLPAGSLKILDVGTGAGFFARLHYLKKSPTAYLCLRTGGLKP
ncbi:MAG: hypothetical protein IJP68_06495 [Selenomonadaceae bacterium]|nr:hypothetical protein [Selenomonadaceae bacterium]